MVAFLSISIVHHPSRSESLAAMLDELDGFDGDLHVSVDNGQGLIANARSAWAFYDPLAKWHLVLEDDLLLPRGFQRSVEAALRYAPEVAPVSFFQIAPRYTKAYDEGYCWYIDNGTNWAQALAVPTFMVDPFLAWEQREVAATHRWFCQRLYSYVQVLKMHVQMTLPCLVQHLDLPSMAGNPKKAGGTYQRTAAAFMDPAPHPEYWRVASSFTVRKNNHAKLPADQLL